MSSSTSFNFIPLQEKYIAARQRSYSYVHETRCIPRIIPTTSKYEYCNSTTQHLYSVRVNHQRRTLQAANNPPAEAPAPSGPPSRGWSKWLLLTIIPLIFSFYKSKWGPLLVLKQKLDMTIATVDVLADAIEDVAEKVDKMADEISAKLPEDSSLKNAMDTIGDLAEKTDKAAERVDDLLEQMEDARGKLKKLIGESAKEKAKGDRSDTPKDK